MSDPVVILHQPELQEPMMIVGFGGWPNAGEVSTWVVAHLLRTLGGTKCAEILPEPFFDLNQQRPVVAVQGGRIQSMEFPGNAFYATKLPSITPRDLILFLGQEPHLQWPRFVEAFLDVAQRFGVTEILTVGGLYDNVPHTVEPRVTGLTNQEKQLQRLSETGVFPADYEGPMSIHTHLLVAAGQRRMLVSTLWGHVPYYIQSNNAKTCLAIMERLQRLLDFQVDLKDLRQAAEVLDEEIDRIIQGKPELLEYIQGLEKDYTVDTTVQAVARPARYQASGEKIIRIDPFLRKG
jgi:proteasome assembly chaperone (PAC2) family protein